MGCDDEIPTICAEEDGKDEDDKSEDQRKDKDDESKDKDHQM